MERYIDANKMVSKDNAYTTFPHDLAGCDDNDLVRWINEQPTADVVAVVRCKDCIYRFRKNGHDKDGCPLDRDGMMGDNDFCSCGESATKEDECMFCDAVIPEGRQVCPNCERKGFMTFRECTECSHFVSCEFSKQVFHKTTRTQCDDFKELMKDGCIESD